MSSAFNTFYANLPPPAESLAILLGFAELTIFGLAGLANPNEFANSFGLPIKPSSSTTLTKSDKSAPIASQETSDNDPAVRNQKALVAAINARNIQNGILLLTLACYVRDRRALGIAVACSFVPTFADALITNTYGVAENVWAHVFGMVNTAAVGASLLYWGRQDPWW